MNESDFYKKDMQSLMDYNSYAETWFEKIQFRFSSSIIQTQ